jgi:hypothetical protein
MFRLFTRDTLIVSVGLAKPSVDAVEVLLLQIAQDLQPHQRSVGIN